MGNKFLYVFILLVVFSSHATAGNLDAEVLQMSTEVIFDGKKLTQEWNYTIQINNRSGDIYSSFSVPYSPIINIVEINGYISDPSGKSIKKLSEKDIITYSAGSEEAFYDDMMVKYFTLKHNTYPYIIHYSYRTEQQDFLFLVNWTPVQALEVPTHKAELTISAPSGVPIHWDITLMQEPEVNTDGKLVTYRWSGSYDGKVKEEEYCPPMDKLLPGIQVMPENFTYDIPGSNKSWQSFGKWVADLGKDLQELPENEKATIHQLTDSIEDSRRKIEELYHRLQDETRYINVNIETGGLKPFSAEYVSENKYGDCKALSNYFRAVLKEAGINSYYTLINAGSTIVPLVDSVPYQQFNHAIVMVPLNNDTLWVDCTSDGAFAFPGSYIQNRKALVIDEGESRLMEVPALTNEQVHSGTKIVFSNHADTVYASVSNVFRGEYYEIFQQISTSLGHTSMRQILQEFIIIPGFELLDFTVETLHRDSAYISLKYNAKAVNEYMFYNDEVLIHPVTYQVPLVKPPGERKLPVQFNYPLSLSDTMIFNVNEGCEILSVPEDVHISTRFGSYQRQTSIHDDEVQLIKEMIIGAGYYSLEEYTDLHAFLEQLRLQEKDQYILLKKSSEL